MQAHKTSPAGTSFNASLPKVAGTSFERLALLFCLEVDQYWKILSLGKKDILSDW